LHTSQKGKKKKKKKGKLSSREELRTRQKAKHSLVFCQLPALAAMFPQEADSARVVDAGINENLYLCPGHKFALKAYFKIVLV
jgi:hypothetical protein